HERRRTHRERPKQRVAIIAKSKPRLIGTAALSPWTPTVLVLAQNDQSSGAMPNTPLLLRTSQPRMYIDPLSLTVGRVRKWPADISTGEIRSMMNASGVAV